MTPLDHDPQGTAAPDQSAADADYVSPTYLRAPFREFLFGFDKGVYWLRAPSQVGKTMFVRGIIAKRPGKDPATSEGIDSNAATGIRAFGVHISKGTCASPRQFVAALEHAFQIEFALSEAEGAECAPGIRFGDAAEAHADFLGWLQKLQSVAIGKGAQRLLLCIDGLEEMSAPGSGAAEEPFTIGDMLPAAAEIPAGVVLLITSLPREEWPADLFDKIEAKFTGGHGYIARNVTLADADYEKMLRSYFWDAVRTMFRARAIAHLEKLVESKAKLSKDRDERVGKDLAFRDGLKGDWKKLTNKYPRYSMDKLPVGDLQQTLDEIDKLWADLMDRADRRFGLVSLVLARVVDGSLPLEQVAALPRGEGLRDSLQAA